jgi:hypothetical protein
MEKDKLISALENGRAEFLECIQDLSNDVLEIPGVIDNWSVKDILVHLTRWEAEIIKLVWQVGKGIPPTTAHFVQSSVDETNERWYQESRSRLLKVVLDDFLGVRNQTIRRVKDLSQVELTDHLLSGKPLWEWIANDSFGHEAEHMAQIKSWQIREGLDR